MTDYGLDVLALEDLEDPELLVSGDLNVCYAIARSLLEPPDTHAEIGDPDPADTIDIRSWLGGRWTAQDLAEREREALAVVVGDDRVASAEVSVSYDAGRASVSVSGQGADGPFAFVLTTDGVSAAFLRSDQ